MKDKQLVKKRCWLRGGLIGTRLGETFNKGSKNIDFTFKPNKLGINLKLRVEVEEK